MEKDFGEEERGLVAMVYSQESWERSDIMFLMTFKDLTKKSVTMCIYSF